ncbi:hypothetical protein PR048_028303 [Dryococelus australis]|uniref:HTH psq-type domain-containing protein n=1 Tax=Dryococelus australis TaxID=614101 RepID=A0ABQ9GIW3_9NEOP|nr:hypothetical protein PR048_028303 [Dryococelus australis]
MSEVILAFRGKEMGLSRASKLFDVPIFTLKDKVNSREEDVDKLFGTKLGRNPTLRDEIEDALMKYCLVMEVRFFGLTAKGIKRMAFQLTENNKGEDAAGWKWLH